MVNQMFSGIFLVLSCVLLNAQTQAQEGGKKRSPEPLERTDRRPQYGKGFRPQASIWEGIKEYGSSSPRRYSDQWTD